MNGIESPLQSELTRFVRKLQCQVSITAALASLEQRHQLSLNVLLYAIWFAYSQHGRLRKAQFQILELAQQPWHDKVFLALRRLQQKLNGNSHPKALRARAWVTTEVTRAQEIEQIFLMQSLSESKTIYRSASQQLIDACHNIALYFRIRQLNLGNEDRAALQIVLQEVFPSSAAMLVQQNLAEAIARAHVDQPAFEQLNLM